LETLVKDKGVAREDKSEGSRRQNCEWTNRNTIQVLPCGQVGTRLRSPI